jgi:hypothetical protein
MSNENKFPSKKPFICIIILRVCEVCACAHSDAWCYRTGLFFFTHSAKFIRFELWSYS